MQLYKIFFLQAVFPLIFIAFLAQYMDYKNEHNYNTRNVLQPVFPSPFKGKLKNEYEITILNTHLGVTKF